MANAAAMITLIATMAAENKQLASKLMMETEDMKTPEPVAESTNDAVNAVAQKLAAMNNANKPVTEDHAETEEPAESTAEFSPEDKVETKDGRYGTVTGVDDPTGDITILLDDGETAVLKPEELVIVDEKGVDESVGAGDEVELEDGRRAQVTGTDDATGDLTLLTDEGETLTVPNERVKIVNDKSSPEDTEEKVEGQQSDGSSVDVKE